MNKQRTIGKQMLDFYIYKDYVNGSKIPEEIYSNAVTILKNNFPEFQFTIVRWSKQTNNICFLYCPDWDNSPEPFIQDSVLVKQNGETRYSKPKADPQIYHQKWQFVGDDYQGFSVEESKERTKKYTSVISEIAKDKGISTKEISSRIGTKSYWEREIVPMIVTKNQS